jgi:hypothetical protein
MLREVPDAVRLPNPPGSLMDCAEQNTTCVSVSGLRSGVSLRGLARRSGLEVQASRPEGGAAVVVTAVSLGCQRV